jgi:hypothetical protein
MHTRFSRCSSICSIVSKVALVTKKTCSWCCPVATRNVAVCTRSPHTIHVLHLRIGTKILLLQRSTNRTNFSYEDLSCKSVEEARVSNLGFLPHCLTFHLFKLQGTFPTNPLFFFFLTPHRSYLEGWYPLGEKP